MGRFDTNKAYAHRVQRMGHDAFRISWTVDRYYAGSRLRFPTTTRKDTDEVGARRFAKKHGLDFPELQSTP